MMFSTQIILFLFIFFFFKFLSFFYIFGIFQSQLLDDFSYLFGNLNSLDSPKRKKKIKEKRRDPHQLHREKDDRKVKKSPEDKDPKVRNPPHIALRLARAHTSRRQKKVKEILKRNPFPPPTPPRIRPPYLQSRSKKGAWPPHLPPPPGDGPTPVRPPFVLVCTLVQLYSSQYCDVNYIAYHPISRD